MSSAVAPPPRIEVSQVSQADQDYSDDSDFEKELDAFIQTTEDKSPALTKEKDGAVIIDKPDTHLDNKEADKDVREIKKQSENKESKPEKGTEEIEKGQKESIHDDAANKKNYDQTEGDDYSITDDQQRALSELMKQKEENDVFPDEDPPEYDVKEKLVKINAELAQDPTPTEPNRETKVGFKDKLVDLVAPPPDFSEDEDSQRDKVTGDGTQDKSKGDEVDGGTTGSDSSKKSKNVVIEKDGKFEVVSPEDLTASERELFNIQESSKPKMKEDSGKKTEKDTNNSNIHAQSKQPSPPPKPRPATANNSIRRNLRPVSAPQRPHSAVTHNSSSTNSDYNSPYAMSSQEKQRAQQRTHLLEERKRDEYKRKKKELEEKRKENNEAFHAWLRKKREDDKKKKQEEEEEKKKQAKTDMSEENDEAFLGWLRDKKKSIRHDKLLKKRQQQEMQEGYYVHSRDDCDKAFREWVRKKNIDMRKVRTADKQRNRAHRITMKRSRKSQALFRAIRQSQSFRYVDYYGYRF